MNPLAALQKLMGKKQVNAPARPAAQPTKVPYDNGFYAGPHQASLPYDNGFYGGPYRSMQVEPPANQVNASALQEKYAPVVFPAANNQMGTGFGDIQASYDVRAPQPTYQSVMQPPMQGGAWGTGLNRLHGGNNGGIQARQSNWYDF